MVPCAPKLPPNCAARRRRRVGTRTCVCFVVDLSRYGSIMRVRQCLFCRGPVTARNCNACSTRAAARGGMHAARVRKSAWKAPERRQRAHTRTKHTHTNVPEPDGRLDVADVLPGAGLARPSEQEQVLQCVPLSRMPLNVKVDHVCPFLHEPLISMPWNTPLRRTPCRTPCRTTMQTDHAERPSSTTV